MLDLADVRRIALALSGASESANGEQVAFSVGGRGFAWTYMARAAPKQPRVARPDVLAVRCPLDRKAMLIEAAPDLYFDDGHYRGFPAVLVRLARIEEAEFAALLESAWRLQAAKPPPRPRAKRKR